MGEQAQPLEAPTPPGRRKSRHRGANSNPSMWTLKIYQPVIPSNRTFYPLSDDSSIQSHRNQYDQLKSKLLFDLSI
jgi:hypothetical protein